MAMKINKDSKGNINQIIITDATFYYTCIRKPVAIYDDRKLPYAQARKEYKTTVAVDEDTADQWDEIFGKQPSQKHSNQKFVENYKLDDVSEVPYPDEKKQFTIKVTQKAQKKDGSAIDPRAIPKVFKREGKKGVEIGKTTNVGNGSKGTLVVRVMTNDYGSFAYLDTLAIDTLVEYDDNSGAVNKDTLDALGFDDIETQEMPEESQEEMVSPASEDFGEEPPFDMDDGDTDF